jgi:hypothetical protein
MSDCLHCDINALVQQRIDAGEMDLSDLAAMIVESLAELVLLAPEGDRPKVMADALAHFGYTFLEKSGVAEAGSSGARH